jgi:hypothetical protein
VYRVYAACMVNTIFTKISFCRKFHNLRSFDVYICSKFNENFLTLATQQKFRNSLHVDTNSPIT